VKINQAASIADLGVLARRRLPRMVFDYIDGAAGEEVTARRNATAFERFELLPEVLVDVSKRDLQTTVFGQRPNPSAVPSGDREALPSTTLSPAM